MRVLAVDDEPDVLLLCRVNLAFEGHETIEAVDAHQGLELALSEKPDVILLDIMLPGGDGLTLLRDLKSRPETRDIPVILLTAKAREEDQIKGWQAGAVLYITKPFSPAALTEAVTAVANMAPEERMLRREENLRHLTVLHNR